MRHRWSVPVLLALAALGGYAVGARPVQAQDERFPFQQSDTVTVAFHDHSTRSCWIREIKGTFARCGSAAEREGPAIGRREPPEEWLNLAVVEGITKRNEQR